MLVRYAPEIPFPKYAFVPGRHPHPVTDPRGHHFGCPQAPVGALDPADPLRSREYLFAIDLFNAGYYWEAHEAWEGLWIAAGRRGAVADFLKGLIKLAAAGVKAREGSSEGVVRHARRARELLETIRSDAVVRDDQLAGLGITRLIEIATELTERPVIDAQFTVEGRPVLGARLCVATDIHQSRR